MQPMIVLDRGGKPREPSRQNKTPSHPSASYYNLVVFEAPFFLPCRALSYFILPVVFNTWLPGVKGDDDAKIRAQESGVPGG